MVSNHSQSMNINVLEIVFRNKGMRRTNLNISHFWATLYLTRNNHRQTTLHTLFKPTQLSNEFQGP